MSATPTTTVTYYPWGLTGLLRMAIAAALAGGAAYGVMAITVLSSSPFDPLNLFFEGLAGGTGRIVQLAALLLVLSSLTAMVVRRPSDAGLFAAALAVGFLAQERPGMAYLLMRAGAPPFGLSATATYVTLALEAVVWAMLILACWVAGRMVETRIFNLDHTLPTVDLLTGQPISCPPATFWVVEPAVGVKAAWITLVAGAALIFALCQNLEPGQIAFGAWFSLFAATLIAHRMTSFRMAVWPLAALTVLMVGGYVLAAWQPTPPQPNELLTILPPNHWAYPTPAQYAAFGGLGVVTGLWFSQRLHRLETVEKQSSNLAAQSFSL